MALLLEYGFNEGSGTTAADSSGNDVTLAVAPSTGWAPGVAGTALASGAFTSTGTIEDVVPRFTIMGWVKVPGAIDDYASFFETRPSGDTAHNIYIEVQDNLAVGVYLQADGGYSTGYNEETTLPDTDWHHIAWTYSGMDATTVAQFFIDGTLVYSENIANSGRLKLDTFYINRYDDLADPGGQLVIDEFRAFDSVLSGADIITQMNTHIGGGSTAYPVTGTSAATAGGTGHVTAKLGVTGHADVTSTASGAVTMKFPVAGTAVATSTAQGSVFPRLDVSGTSIIDSAAQGAITAARPVLGVAGVVSDASGSVTMVFDVSGTAEAVSGASGAVSGEDGLSGTVAASSDATGQITATLHISGHSDSVSGAQGALEYADGLSGTAEAVTTVSGDVTANHAVSGTIEVRSAASGALIATWTVSGTAPAVSGASGDVRVTGALVPPWPKEMSLAGESAGLTMVELVNVLTVTELTVELTLDEA